jgi:GAF domain
MARVASMNTERLVREIERRLAFANESVRAEVLDAVREEVGRERRRNRLSPIETERTRRVEAETLREILEAINRQARLLDTIDEVLKQLARIVVFDSCSLALLEPGEGFRIVAARGFPDREAVVGKVLNTPITEEIREKRWPIALADAQADERYFRSERVPEVRSWAGIPLMVEGEVIGLLCLDRNRVEPFDDEDLHRAKGVSFSAAAAIRKARLLEQVRRYAALMERTVAVDQAVFAGKPQSEVQRAILEGAVQLGGYPGGLLVFSEPGGPRIAAAVGDAFAPSGIVGQPAPAELLVDAAGRLAADDTQRVARALGIRLPAVSLYLVPIATPERTLGSLALLDPDGATPDDQLMDAYASRAATAYLYSQRRP